MGNEQSQLSGIEIDPKVIELSDFWSQHNATITNIENVSKLSVFSSELFLNESFWAPQIPLERFSKNLMLYRHPCIIKYISSWQKTSKFYLAVEEVTPLSQKINQVSTTEICLGLYSILKALCFLHEKANVSHNNVCLASIFVSKEGSWKLGGMEYLCSYKSLSPEYLQKSRSHRYSKAIDSNEDKHLKTCGERKDFVDVFGFCTLANELLKNRSNDDFSNLLSFKEFCTRIIQEPNILLRPKLCSLLDHEFFQHKFIHIHSYLIELPLKNDAEKSEFFTHLKVELEELPEEIVASQFGRLLVSRMVLLNSAARAHIIPYIMIPRKGENGAMFSENNFKKFIAPNLLSIFGVRDAQIRLLLLEYFPHFLECFSKQDLQLHILPELLVGIKDTNNDLVAATLHTLAELVPVLGADVVIGGKRAKLFNDGRPKSQSSSRKSSKIARQEVVAISVSPNSGIENLNSPNSGVELIDYGLPERPRPDGEEGETSTEEVEQSAEEDGENWEDWDNENASAEFIPVESDVSANDLTSNSATEGGNINNNQTIDKSKKILDITQLDIKIQTRIELEKSEIDFFEDMEPVIKANKFVIDFHEDTKESVNNKLSVNLDEVKEEGWGDDWE